MTDIFVVIHGELHLSETQHVLCLFDEGTFEYATEFIWQLIAIADNLTNESDSEQHNTGTVKQVVK